jgi:hypothetical protein
MDSVECPKKCVQEKLEKCAKTRKKSTKEIRLLEIANQVSRMHSLRFFVVLHTLIDFAFKKPRFNALHD